MLLALHADTGGLAFILTAGTGGVVFYTSLVSVNSRDGSAYFAVAADSKIPFLRMSIGLSLFAGNVQYNIASTCSFAHNFPQQYQKWSADAIKWLITVMYTSGGACYLLAGLFYVLTDTGPKFWKGKPGKLGCLPSR